MGLTIHYQLHLPESAGPTAARAAVEDLRKYARSLRFSSCSKVVDWDHRHDDPAFGFFHHIIMPCAEAPGEDQFLDVEPLEFCMFAIEQPGSESARFGLGRYADTAPLFNDPDAQYPTGLDGFQWRTFCKTQYASLSKHGGWENFFKIHDGICRILDHAATQGIKVSVHDEGEYWTKRDPEALHRQIDHWNNLIAAFTGRLKDALGKDRPGAVIAPITEDPTFEHMEAMGQEFFEEDEPPGS